jgi:hypothetical protein
MIKWVSFLLNFYSLYKSPATIEWYQDNCRVYLDEYDQEKEYYFYLVDDDPYFENRWIRRN